MKEVVVIAGGRASVAGTACNDHLRRAGYEVCMAPSATDSGDLSTERGVLDPDSSSASEEETRLRRAELEADFLVDVVNRGQGLHVLINFGNRVLAGAAEDTSEHEMRRCFEEDYFALAQRVRAVAPAMRLQGAGAIINVAESAGVGPGAFFSHHRAVQAAIGAFSSSLCEEMRPFGIEVSFVEARSAVSGPALTQSRQARLSRLYWNHYKRALREAQQTARSAPRALAMQIERIIARAGVAKRLNQKHLENRTSEQLIPLFESQPPIGSHPSGLLVRQMVPARSRRSRRRGATPSPAEFHGEWEREKQRLVESAISDHEALRLLQTPRSAENLMSWYCTAEVLPNGCWVYTANRMGLGRVLTASTAGALARQISSAPLSLA